MRVGFNIVESITALTEAAKRLQSCRIELHTHVVLTGNFVS